MVIHIYNRCALVIGARKSFGRSTFSYADEERMELRKQGDIDSQEYCLKTATIFHTSDYITTRF